MPYNPDMPTGNQLLDAMPLADLEVIAPDLEWVEFSLHQSISESGQPMNYAYFPVSGLCSAITMAEIEDQVEMGLIGNEGFIGAAIVLQASHDPFRLICQAPGRMLCLPSAKLIEASAMPGVRAVLLRFIHVFMVQAASTILANSSYLVEERLARLILMTYDRLGTSSFPMTYQFMALMLAVRRAGVTEAINRLEERHLIHAVRGTIQVLDRAGLEALANNSYGHVRRQII